METVYYIVKSIDGDYANLVKEDEPGGDTKLVARALLPEGISEGCRLKFEFLQYEIV
ncbi:MAG: chorismate--pyruvate lyase [Lachnospiraceae bacterium]|nr:chorismate--pyruvate lyase [Lachnospiraceae bacterium]MBQ9934839.1 chorismate--pyruvate lyase [Lachnospiraceae bacterium]